MNRAVQKMHQRRCALKNNLYGGGLAVNPEASFLSENGVPYAENQHYSDCYTQERPGELATPANPELAQVGMAGGYNKVVSHPSSRRLRSSRRLAGGKRQGCGLMRGGYQIMSAAQLTALTTKGGRRTRGGGCGCWKLRGGQCGKPEVAWLGGKRTRKQRGGNKGGFEMAVADNIGGSGPIAEPVRAAIPCEARAGAQNPFSVTPMAPDVRTAYGYSLTPNTTTPSLMAGGGSDSGAGLSERVPNFEYSQTGAGYGGNAYPAACYRAPGSEMPVYPATTAGFHFTPSTQAGATLPDGVTAYNEVVAHAARLGGGRRSRKTYRKKAKAKKSRSRRH